MPGIQNKAWSDWFLEMIIKERGVEGKNIKINVITMRYWRVDEK